MNLKRRKFKLPEFIIETPNGTKRLIFDAAGNLKKIESASQNGKSFQQTKDEHDKHAKEIQRQISAADGSSEYRCQWIKILRKMPVEIDLRSLQSKSFKVSGRSCALQARIDAIKGSTQERCGGKQSGRRIFLEIPCGRLQDGKEAQEQQYGEHKLFTKTPAPGAGGKCKEQAFRRRTNIG